MEHLGDFCDVLLLCRIHWGGLVFVNIQLYQGAFILNRYQLPDTRRSRGEVLPEYNLYDTSDFQGLLTYKASPKTSTNLCVIRIRVPPGQIHRFIRRTPKYPAAQ